MSEEKRQLDQAELAPFLHDVAQEKNGKPAEQKRDKEISCGFWIFKSPFLQRLATEKMYVLIYGIGGCLLSMSLAYFSGTITMLEKRYKIPTQVSGIILVGNDMSMMITSVLAGYYIHRGHRPRWIGAGFFTIFIFCMLTSSLHFMYGPGEDALKLTREYADARNISGLMTNGTSRTEQKLCMTTASSCIKEAGFWIPQFVLFLGQFISGIGIGLFWSVGVAYMDDNTSKAKSPAMLSATAFLRMLGPAIGYSLASMCLRFYVDPSLHPLIKPGDPRWLGAWWMGWLIIGGITFLVAFLMCLFPAELPSAKARRLKLEKSGKQDPTDHKDLSVSDMWCSVKRLAVNKVFMYNTFAQSLYLFGYLAYWIYTPKYIETQYRQSASTATLATGSIALGFSAAGVVISGYVVSKYKPKARTMAAWNALVDFLTVAGCLCYIIIACKGSDKLGDMATTSACSEACHCEYVHYAPVCTPNNVTFISACHAGCTGKIKDPSGRNLYTGCSCIGPTSNSTGILTDFQHAVDGACPVDCSKQFLVFLVVLCVLKFIGASSKSTSILITLRCILPQDKSLAMGISGLAASVMALIPSPIFFGWLLDKYCLVWGKTCSNKGNCWLYDTESLRYAFNLISAFFIFLGGLLNIMVWFNSKDLRIFDDEHYEKATELTEVVKTPKEPQEA